MVVILDSCINILNDSTKDLKNVTEEMLDNLDKMLGECNVSHAFSLLTAYEVVKIHERNPGCEYRCSLMYQEEDETVVDLVYALWTKLYRGASDELIRNVFAKKYFPNTKIKIDYYR